MKYICTGRIYPERANVNLSQIKLKLEKGTAVVSCGASQITVILDESSLDGYISAQIMANDIANILINALGFSLGTGYRVEISQVTEADNNNVNVIGVKPSIEDQTLEINPYIPIFNQSYKLSSKDIFFRLALYDYSQAITDVKDCATYCYRAIEGIKSAFVFETGKDRWDDMHQSLKTDKETIKSIVQQYADPARHGNWVNAKPTNKFDRWKMLLLTRDILIKYMNYANKDDGSSERE